jgi:SAM-dependent methyltransferase
VSAAAALAAALARSEAQRDRRGEPHPALVVRARRLRHQLHLLPGDRVLELGCGDGRFARALGQVTRGECAITAATLAPGAARPGLLPSAIEHVATTELPGALAGRTFEHIVARGLLAAGGADVLVAAQELLAPGGQLVLLDSNPWGVTGLRAKVLPRAELLELLSELGFVRASVAFEDLRVGGWLGRHLSTLLEQAPGARALARGVVVRAQRPPRDVRRQAPRLDEHAPLRRAVSVVVPCRNEEMNVEPLVRALRAHFDDYLHEVVLVDDNSTDGTREVMARLAAEDPRVRPVLRSPPNGVGRALADGFRAATGAWVLTMDCDFQHLMPEVRDVFDAAARGRDVVVGSRFSRESIVRHYPLPKLIANRAFHALAQVLLGSRFRDLTNNLKLMRREVVARLPLTQPGFAANAETGLLPVLMGCDVEEVPTSWVDRSPDMGASSFRLAKVGGGYTRVLLDLLRARLFGSGPYAAAVARGARGRTTRGVEPALLARPTGPGALPPERAGLAA